MKLLLVLTLSVTCFAADKPKPPETTNEVAYQVAVNRIMALLKAPSTARFSPIEECKFERRKNGGVMVWMNVDAQNSFGAMLREKWGCQIGTVRKDGKYRAICDHYQPLFR